MKTCCLKAALVVCIVVASVSFILPAQRVLAGPVAYIGLYDSGDRINAGYCFEYSELYEQFDVWVWVLPGDEGMICAEFSIDHHDWVYVIGQIPNPDHYNTLGSPIYPDGVSICFGTCQTEWTWLYHLQMLTKEIETGYIEIREHPDAGAYQIANCNEGYPFQPVTILNYFGYVHEDWLDEYFRITGVSVIDLYTIIVSFGTEKCYNSTPTTYTIYNTADITDTLHVQQSTMPGAASASIVLSNPMQESGSYVIDVKHYCTEIVSPCGYGLFHPCGDFDYQFDAHFPVATRASSWGAIKSLAGSSQD